MAQMEVYEAEIITAWIRSGTVWKRLAKNILGDKRLIYKEGLTVQCVSANTETRSL